MLIKTIKASDCRESEVTTESCYHNRRSFLRQLGFVGASALLTQPAQAGIFDFLSKEEELPQKRFKQQPLTYKTSGYTTKESLTPEAKVISHNNFYEFGYQKSDPVNNAQNFQANPWQLSITGEVRQPLTLTYDDLFKSMALEERIYRLRCVEAWSMVIPWVGFGLADLLKRVEPTMDAKYVVFKTLYDPKQMPGQASRYVGGGIRYPYVEGLRIDEAMNPLSFLSVGVYGKTLPPQNGAPIRLVLPWKYGFKSIKSIVGIELRKSRPKTTWNKMAPQEYGFYANVNPEVDHPRWSQASERRITGGGLLAVNRIPTTPFNGYGEEVAHLYQDLNLRKNY